jgi:hypothetical protein
VTAPRQDGVRFAGEGSHNPSLTASGGGYSAFAPLVLWGREKRGINRENVREGHAKRTELEQADYGENGAWKFSLP